MKLPGRVPRDDDVPTLEAMISASIAKPSLVIEPELRRRSLRWILMQMILLTRPRREGRRSRDLAEQIRTANLTWSPRRQYRRDAASPRRRRRGRHAIEATRLADARANARRWRRVHSTQENMREYLAEQAADEEKRKAKEAEDEALYGPRFRKSWTATGASRRIES